MSTLGQTIRMRRGQLGLTQEELAERVGDGVRQAEISRLENDGVALPRRHRLEQLASALDLPMGVLLARSGWTGAEGEFPPRLSDDPEPDEAIAIFQYDPDAAAANGSLVDSPDVPRLHDAIFRARQTIHNSETAIEVSRLANDQVQKMLLEQRRQRAGAETSAKN